jgi:hypothetical protein
MMKRGMLVKNEALAMSRSQIHSGTAGQVTEYRNTYTNITGTWSLIFLGVKIIHLIVRTDLFTINNIVLGGEAIVTDLYSSLEGQRE